MSDWLRYSYLKLLRKSNSDEIKQAIIHWQNCLNNSIEVGYYNLAKEAAKMLQFILEYVSQVGIEIK